MGWDGFDGCVADVEEFKGDPVDSIEGDDREEEPPGWGAGEEVRVDAPWVEEDEAEGGFGGAVDGGVGVDEAEDFEHGPEDEAEDEGIALSVSQVGIREGGGAYAVFPARIIMPMVMSV